MADRMTLEEYVSRAVSSGQGNRYEVMRKIYEDIVNGGLTLYDPNPPKTFEEYIIRLDYSAGFWFTILFSGLALLLSFLNSTMPPIAYARLVLGAVFILFFPGYATLEALSSGDGALSRLSDLEKVAVSMGLSLAIVPLIGFLLSFTPFEISGRAIGIVLFAYIVVMTTYASYTRFKELISRK